MGWPYTPTLAELTATALDGLATDPEGFFLMVEGSQIDNAASANDGAKMIDDVRSFDDAVQVALDFALANPDTLIDRDCRSRDRWIISLSGRNL